MSTDSQRNEEFRAEVIQLDHRVVVALSGELDVATAPVLETCLAELAGRGATDIEIDLSELRYLDSTGVATLIRHRIAFEAEGGSLMIQDRSAQSLTLLGGAGMSRYLKGMMEGAAESRSA